MVVLLSLADGRLLREEALKRRVDRMWKGQTHVETSDLTKCVTEMATEGLVSATPEKGLKLTPQGTMLSQEWRSLLLKREPVLEIVAGLTDGSITALIVILSALIGHLSRDATLFAAFLTLASVAITGFSSFFLGGITEDLADISTLQNLINYSLSDIPDRRERDRSLSVARQLFSVLRDEISRTNLRSAALSSTTTFLAGATPIAAYVALSRPLNVITSFCFVILSGFFLVRYRSKHAKLHLKVILLQTAVIIAIAVIVSLLIGTGL